MTKVVGVSFKNKGRVYYFLPGELDLKKGNKVIVETGRGLQYGEVESDYFDIDEAKLKAPLKTVLRFAKK